MVRMNDCEYHQATCIQLSPFFHQVGGHSSMFQYDKNTICKVLESPELDFYQSMPDSLKKFTPEFRGIVTVQYCEDELGYIQLVARPETDDEDLPTTTDQSSADTKKSVQLRCSEDGQINYSNNLGNDIVNYEHGKITTSKINPWSLQLCKKQAEKLHRQFIGDENVTILQKYILLENVTAKFHHPCILDLKMGKRQHADIDSDKKRLSKIQKCESSTSSTLGVRLCGMQVYQIDNSRYIFTDKYCGRSLTVDGFRSALGEFFDNGQSKRLDVLPEILERLQSLYETINSLLKYRFYSGSLLIVYDGFTQSNLIDIRMIDFAHSINNEISSEPDRDYLFGLERLMDVFKAILNQG
jgi:inositol-hexakisphosphate kinase